MFFSSMGFRQNLCCASFQPIRLCHKSRQKAVVYSITIMPLLQQESHLIWQVSITAFGCTIT